MKNTKLFDSISGLDEKEIIRADVSNEKKRPRFGKIIAVAAAAVLLSVAVLVALPALKSDAPGGKENPHYEIDETGIYREGYDDELTESEEYAVNSSFYLKKDLPSQSDLQEEYSENFSGGEMVVEKKKNEYTDFDIEGLEDNCFIPFMLIPKSANGSSSRNVAKIYQIRNELIIDIQTKHVSEETGLDYATVKKYLTETRHNYDLPENFFDGWSQQEIEKFMSERAPQAVLDSVKAFVSSEEYLNELRNSIESNEKIAELLENERKTIAESVLNDISEKLTSAGCAIVHDINDPGWLATLAIESSPAIACAVPSVFSKLYETIGKDYYICKAPEKPYRICDILMP